MNGTSESTSVTSYPEFKMDFSVALLHEDMWDKNGRIATTSLTLIDVHDIARSAATYGLKTAYIAHPASAMRELASQIQRHWLEGFGATYNPTRHEAISHVKILSSYDECVADLQARTGKKPITIATSARDGATRVSFPEMRKRLKTEDRPFLLMLGTGWGMGPRLISDSEVFLEPVKGPVPFNHLSVRSACAILLDRLLSPQHG